MTISPRLEELLRHLRGLERPDAAALARALREPVTFEDLRAFVRFDDAGYVRAEVFRSEQVELRLHCWLPGQSTSLHGHGESACVLKVLRGSAKEIALGARDRVWSPGRIVVEDRACVHQVENEGADALVTLHAYSPPLGAGALLSERSDRIVIIGGGFSAAALACRLLQQGGPNLRIDMIEMGPWLGRGIAYGVDDDVFHLNVPASRMSMNPEEPDEFVRFAGAEAAPHAFLPRALYGRYVTSRLAASVRESRAKVKIWRDEAVAVRDDMVVLRSGRCVRADGLVLATGLTPRLHREDWHPRIADAWDERALATLPNRGDVLLLGSGLSALDVVALLDSRGFEGRITVASPRGLLPLSHAHAHAHAQGAQGTALRSSYELLANPPSDLGALVREVREWMVAVARSDEPWQRCIDLLRPHVARFYRGLSPRDQARFVRHVRPYWNILRHRAPPEALARVSRWEREGRLLRIAGRVHLDTRDPDVIHAEIRERSGARRKLRFDAVVRCIGPALDVAETMTPLQRSLLDCGRARLAANGLGIETDTDGRVIDARGVPASRLFAMGALRRASDWETTSVPDIAPHALRIARELLR